MIRSSVLAMILATATCLVPSPAIAQSMKERLESLFIFSAGNTPLLLGGGVGVHGEHFTASDSESNDVLLSFLDQTIAANVANFPLSSTVAGQRFTFVDGIPTPSTTSLGPIFAERAQTLGKGRFNVALSNSRLHFSSLRGLPLEQIQLTFVHAPTPSEAIPHIPECQRANPDCSEYGSPVWEHDLIELDMSLDMQAEVYSLYGSYGVNDWLDVALAVPIVTFRFSGVSNARIVPSSGLPALHFFGGTPEAPILDSQTGTSGSTTGLGDIAARLKAHFYRGSVLDMATLAEFRLPTGREDDFLGTGSFNARGMLIGSAILNDFSPHVNAGLSYRGAEYEQNTLDLVAGFDHRLADWATVAVDMLSSFRLGSSKVEFPDPVLIPANFRQEIHRTNIPQGRDHVIDGSFGFKFRTESGVTIIANMLVPLNTGGLRPSVTPVLGVEYGR